MHAREECGAMAVVTVRKECWWTQQPPVSHKLVFIHFASNDTAMWLKCTWHPPPPPPPMQHLCKNLQWAWPLKTTQWYAPCHLDITCNENSRKIVKSFILSAVQPILDLLQFAYRAGQGAEDAKLFLLHKLYRHLELQQSELSCLDHTCWLFFSV